MTDNPTDEAALVASRVDRDPRAHRATEPDEEDVLRALYGPPDERGVYTAPGEEPAEDTTGDTTGDGGDAR